MVFFHHPMNHNGTWSPQNRSSGRRGWILRTVHPWRARCSLAHCCGLAHRSRSPGQGRSRDRGPDAKTERQSARSCRVRTRQRPPCNTGAVTPKDSYWFRICGGKNLSTPGCEAVGGGLTLPRLEPHSYGNCCALLGYYAASSGNSLQTFRNNLLVPSSRAKDLLGLFSNSSWILGTLKIGPIVCAKRR